MKLLSPEKVALLQTIGRDYPNSVNALAALTGRTSFNVYRTLKRLNKTCSIRLAPGRRRIRQPVLVASKVRMEKDWVGSNSASALKTV